MKTHLYRHYNAANELIYVGVSMDAVRRLKKHPFADDVVRTEIIVFNTKQEALVEEARVIKAERPKLNVMNLPREDRRGQHTMTAKQYRDAIKSLGLTQGEAAKWMGIGIRTSHGYANGELIPEAVAKLLRLCIKLKLNPEDVK